jgi:hypothetical protein
MAIRVKVMKKVCLLLLINFVEYIVLAATGAVLIDDAINSAGYEICRCTFFFGANGLPRRFPVKKPPTITK